MKKNTNQVPSQTQMNSEKAGKFIATIVIALLISLANGMVVIDIVLLFTNDRWWAELLGCTSGILFYALLNNIKNTKDAYASKNEKA